MVSGTFWKKKTIGSIHSIPNIYPYEVSHLTPFHFRVPSLIFGPMVAKYLAENGVSGTFWKKYWLNSFHIWHLPLWVESLDLYTFSFPSLIFGPLVAKYLAENRVSGILKKIFAQLISYLAFFLMGWVSLPLYIFVFLASFSDLWCSYFAPNGVSGTFWKKYWLN